MLFSTSTPHPSPASAVSMTVMAMTLCGFLVHHLHLSQDSLPRFPHLTHHSNHFNKTAIMLKRGLRGADDTPINKEHRDRLFHASDTGDSCRCRRRGQNRKEEWKESVQRKGAINERPSPSAQSDLPSLVIGEEPFKCVITFKMCHHIYGGERDKAGLLSRVATEWNSLLFDLHTLIYGNHLKTFIFRLDFWNGNFCTRCSAGFVTVLLPFCIICAAILLVYYGVLRWLSWSFVWYFLKLLWVPISEKSR